MLTRFEKTLNRHERDLVKLKPVTLQAPEAANKDANLLTCLADYVGSRIRSALKSVFVTRNEFQELESVIPDNTAHVNNAVKGMTEKFRGISDSIVDMNRKCRSNELAQSKKLNDLHDGQKSFVKRS